jgi:hypothetical protein
MQEIPRPKPITHSIQLAVEGISALYFFRALLRSINIINQIQIQNFGGNEELENFLLALKNTGDFNTVVSIGIIRDAESNHPSNAFKSVCSALRDVELYQPSQPEKFEGANPRIGVLILPNANECGMLETLCLQSVSNDPAIKCIEDYLDCLRSNCLQEPIDESHNIHKARVQAFLASRTFLSPKRRNIWLLGQAADKGDWQWDSPAFDHVKLFLTSLIS